MHLFLFFQVHRIPESSVEARLGKLLQNGLQACLMESQEGRQVAAQEMVGVQPPALGFTALRQRWGQKLALILSAISEHSDVPFMSHKSRISRRSTWVFAQCPKCRGERLHAPDSRGKALMELSGSPDLQARCGRRCLHMNVDEGAVCNKILMVAKAT